MTSAPPDHGPPRRRFALPAVLTAAAVAAGATGVLAATGHLPWSGPQSADCDDAGPLPVTRTADGGLNVVTAADADHVWAFGRFEEPAGAGPSSDHRAEPVPRAYQWDEGAWAEMELPAVWQGTPVFAEAAGPADLWVLISESRDPTGTPPESTATIGLYQYAAMHFDGRRWHRYDLADLPVPVADHADEPRLRTATDLEVAGPSDVWVMAVGSGDPARDRRALRFDGEQWGEAPEPETGRELAAIGPDDIIAVGADGPRLTAERWDGERWAAMDVPQPPGPEPGPEPGPGPAHGFEETAFTDVHAVAADDVWAVGRQADTAGTTAGPAGPSAVLAHWDGAEWSVTRDDDYSGFDYVHGDGDGGLWLRTEQGAILHRDATGDFTAHDPAPDLPHDGDTHGRHQTRADVPATALAPIPGTRTLAAGGSLVETTDGDITRQEPAARICRN
ncbi:hypothetical protein ACFOVU_22820 [Nocardiopsis sediminis]|uniref:Exo-alpha-sialidase n=1 Tax=Nocardiopsis sediminis TaxID=1778267 RepID=A0ABV8FSD4_9ACTN